MPAGMKCSLPDTEEASKDKAQGWSVELDHDMQSGKCCSLSSTSPVAFEFVLSCQIDPSEGEQWDSMERFRGSILVEWTAMCGMLRWN